MTTCIRCHRPLKRPSESGMGPVCAKKAGVEPVREHERDLFGYDLEKAHRAALYRVNVLIESLTAEAHAAVRKSFREARVLLGVWA